MMPQRVTAHTRTCPEIYPENETNSTDMRNEFALAKKGGREQ
jgi:hypothetical protein